MMHRVAVIFDNTIRPDTTGVYCRRALGELVEVEHFLPDELAKIPGGFDLYLNVDDGLRYRLPSRLRPSAWWAIDTHLDLPWYLAKAPDFDFVFSAQRNGAEQLRTAGVANAAWLPLACDPEFHGRRDVALRWDVAFVGHVFPGPREELLDRLRRRFPKSFIGQAAFTDLGRIYSASRAVFNRSLRDDVNMRVFEGLASGSLLLTNDLAANGQAELFRDGVHLATYRDADDLIDKLGWYLQHDDKRRRIADAGGAAALASHTYRHRMESLLQAVDSRPRSVAIAAIPPAASESMGLTSIVMVTFNQLALTQACLQSIAACTPEPYEVIVVDNASTDGTVEFLKVQPSVRLIENASNLGFPKAVNQGLRVIRGRQIVLLNNDCVVTPGWLGRLLAPLAEDLNTGLVGPVSNRVSGEQEVNVDYTDLESLRAFARQWSLAHERQWQETDRLVGFCLLIRREVIDQVGWLDERFGMGNFEDDDFCLRARLAGYRCLIARDSFVHHEGHATFRAADVDLKGLLEHNQRLFAEKWSIAQPTSECTAPPLADHPRGICLRPQLEPSGELRLVEAPIQLSLCMIVRNNAGTLPACLRSIRPWVDEMIVVDTGSTDETPRIAADLGARVFHSPWRDSFSAARNASLAPARGEWVFWMDSDDTIPAACGRELRPLVSRTDRPDLLGYVVQVHCPGPSGSVEQEMTAVDHVKLFRNRPDLRFEFRIHEQILPSIRRAGGEVGWTELHVVHSGSDQTAEGRQRKLQRDLRILALDLAERPDHPFVLFNFGMTYADMQDFSRAVEYLERCLLASQPSESHVRKAYALLVGAYLGLGDARAAQLALADARRLYADDPELLFRQGILAHELGEHERAISAYQQLLARQEERHFSSIDRALFGFKAYHNLALVHEDMGNLAKAEETWRAAVADAPQHRDGWRGLGNVLRAQKKFGPLGELVAELRRRNGLLSEADRLQFYVDLDRGDLLAAERNLRAAIAASPAELDLHETLGRWLSEQGRLEEASELLEVVVQHLPDNAQALHNLGVTCLHLGRLQSAVDYLERSHNLRPENDITQQTLAHARALFDANGHTGSPTKPPMATKTEVDAVRVSLIVAALDSHEVVRRQLRYLDGLLPADWELILIDDGSDPPLELLADLKLNVRLLATNDPRPWTQPLARNQGARASRGSWLFFTDIDHVLSPEAIQATREFRGARMLFARRYGVLDELGQLRGDDSTLAAYGRPPDSTQPGPHQNTFVIRRDIFLDLLGGYDEVLASRGVYGGDDVDLNQRYQELIRTGRVPEDIFGPALFVFPEPARNERGLFHSLRRDNGQRAAPKRMRPAHASARAKE